MLGVPGSLVWVSRREQVQVAIGVKGQAARGPHERWRESEEKPSLASTSVVCLSQQLSVLLPGPPPTSSVESQTCDRPGQQMAPGIFRSSWWSQAVGQWLAASTRFMRAQGSFTHVLSATRHPHQSVTQRPLAQA